MINRLTCCNDGISLDTNGRCDRQGTNDWQNAALLDAGRFILPSRVSEVARVLRENMLVPYDGDRDLKYPEKLAHRIRSFAEQGTQFGFR